MSLGARAVVYGWIGLFIGATMMMSKRMSSTTTFIKSSQYQLAESAAVRRVCPVLALMAGERGLISPAASRGHSLAWIFIGKMSSDCWLRHIEAETQAN